MKDTTQNYPYLKVGSERLCFDYEIRRWYPVANISLYRSAVIYESYSPGKLINWP